MCLHGQNVHGARGSTLWKRGPEGMMGNGVKRDKKKKKEKQAKEKKISTRVTEEPKTSTHSCHQVTCLFLKKQKEKNNKFIFYGGVQT